MLYVEHCMNIKSLQRKRRIMRRIYAHVALRVLTHPITLQLALFAVALLVFAKLVFVHRIYETILSMPLASLPTYVTTTVASALERGEVLTLLALGVMLFVALSVPWQVRQLYVPKASVV